MENVHLAVEEDDLYTGYNDYNPTFDSDVSYILYELASTNLFASVCNLQLTMIKSVWNILGAGRVTDDNTTYLTLLFGFCGHNAYICISM